MVCKNCGGTMHGDGVTLVFHCENTDADTWSLAPDAGPVYCDYEKQKCNHHNKTFKKVMDFSFYICNDCGYQWKA